MLLLVQRGGEAFAGTEVLVEGMGGDGFAVDRLVGLAFVLGANPHGGDVLHDRLGCPIRKQRLALKLAFEEAGESFEVGQVHGEGLGRLAFACLASVYLQNMK